MFKTYMPVSLRPATFFNRVHNLSGLGLELWWHLGGAASQTRAAHQLTCAGYPMEEFQSTSPAEYAVASGRHGEAFPIKRRKEVCVVLRLGFCVFKRAVN